MSRRFTTRLIALSVIAILGWTEFTLAAPLSDAVRKQLETSKYVYIASQRKDGHFGKPAEIWFMFHDGAVWVGTPPTTWRVKRIKAGRTAAKIAVGTPDGPSFEAVGSVVKDKASYDLLLQTYAKKYPEGWSRFEQNFREGFKNGSRVLVKYTPK
jgi:hypothetical protein